MKKVFFLLCVVKISIYRKILLYHKNQNDNKKKRVESKKYNPMI